ncbi:MAG: transcriptional regulator [Deltaproteobacteria bacterium]|jgi:ATP-dependent DNA helicase RecG|nr:transcriptional regulator [Deltaproteobacteria bacterium]
MIPKAENQYIEFKREEVSSQTLAEEIVAFANGEGGEIWLGVDDQGVATGISRSYEEDVMNLCRTAVIPPVTPEYEETDFGEKRKSVKIARIIIAKGSDRPYYTSKNRYFIRVGSTKRIASREELMRLFQASGLFHYDLVEAAGALQKHLNQSAISGYFSRYKIDYLEESEEERERLTMASDIVSKQLIPTVGGLLVFGIAPETCLPQSGISLAVFNGSEIGSELRDKKIFTGSLPLQIDNALSAIKANIATPSTIEGSKRVEKASYPDKVFRELLVNACVHRNYSIIGSQIRVLIFDNKLEFISPGRLPNTVTIDKLTTGTSFARNPLLVKLMENLGYMDRLGRGLPMVYQEAKRLGEELKFEDSGEVFRVTLGCRSRN